MQKKIVRSLSNGNEFVAYVDAIGHLDGTRRLLEWKTTSARYPDQPEGLTSLDLQLVCYSWITGISDVAIVAFVRKRVPEIQYLLASITDEQRQEFGQLVEATARQIETAQFPSHPGIRFPQNGCVSCAHLGLCLGNEALVGTKLIRQPGAATLIGLTCLTTNGRPLVAPKLNRRRAVFVLSKIDEILAWEKATDRERDSKFVELGRYLCEVRAGQYWRVDNVRSFDEFLERKFPESRRKAYYLMAIHEQLPRIHKVELQQVGWAKATELAKVARRDGQRFDSATWLHKARELPKEEFKREVSKHLTGKETEPWEILYFKAYKSQLPVIEQALETAGLMLGSDKSRGYCLEMICADFLAGVSLEAGNQDALLPCLTRLVIGLPKPQRKQLLEEVQVTL